MSSAVASNRGADTGADEDVDCEEVYNSILPAATIDKIIRKKFGGKPVSATTARYTSAAIEHIFAELIRAAGAEAESDKKKRIKMIHLVRATRAHPGLSRFFRSYLFAPRERVDYKSINLLPPKERVAVLKDRAAKQKQKQDSQIPAVDQE